METSLHRELKTIYADGDAECEVPLKQYRIDVVCGDELVEIQHSGLSAIRTKIRKLLSEHRVLVVKPIVCKRRLIKRKEKDGPVVDRRWSPKRGSILSLFDELIHFTNVFPHKRLVLEVPLVDVEEWRFPGHGRRRWRRKNAYQVEDVKLLEIHQVHRFRTAADLRRLMPVDALPQPFHTGHLAEALGVERWFAQRIAYCLRKTGAARQVGKAGNALLYDFARRRRSRSRGENSL